MGSLFFGLLLKFLSIFNGVILEFLNYSDILKNEVFVFDCDGVILNSNPIKSKVFYEVAKPYGEDSAILLQKFHLLNGGISRNVKFEYFLKKVLKKEINQNELSSLIGHYGDLVYKRLIECEVADKLINLKASYPNIPWMLVSGGNQLELRNIFRERGMDMLFEKGIFGSPDSKEVIFQREIETSNLKYPAIFFGDSLYDYLCAKKFNLNFLFVSEWTDLHNWTIFCEQNNVKHIKKLSDLIFS